MKFKFPKFKTVTAALFIFIVFSGIAYASNSTKINVYFAKLSYIIEGKSIQADENSPSFIYNGTTYVPLRFVGEALGQHVTFDNDSKTIIMKDVNQDKQLRELQRLIATYEQEIIMLKNQLNKQPQTDKPTESDKLEYLTYKHGNIILNFTPTAYERYSIVHTDYDNITKIMFDHFGLKDAKVPVNVYIQSLEDRVAHPNEGSFFESGQKIVVINADQDTKQLNNPNYIKFVFVHELSHVLQDAKWGFEMLHNVTEGEKNWIIEGHADYVAKKLSGYSQYGEALDPSGDARDQAYYLEELHYRNGKDGWRPLDWTSIQTFQQLSNHQDEYFAFEAIVNFVVTKYSLKHYFNLLDEMTKGATSAEAIQKVFNKTDVELMNEYKSFYKLN